MTKKIAFLILLVLFFPLNQLCSFGNNDATEIKNKTAEHPVSVYINNISTLSSEALRYALTGYATLLNEGKILKRDIITIVDFSKPSTEERLFVINLRTREVLMKSLCAHGRNSGENWAKKFSNTVESYKSSLGFYIASETYSGAHGYSLRLDGQEKGINDNARERGVVMHAATYVSKAFINATGRLGRSEGCPALPTDQYEKIINLIKGGTCLFIYHPDVYYTAHSSILKTLNEDCIAEMLNSTQQ